MGTLRGLRHNRYKSHRVENSHKVTVSANARPGSPFGILAFDRLTIYFETDTHNGHLSLTPDEIDGLIYELSRLDRFYKDKNRVKNRKEVS